VIRKVGLVLLVLGGLVLSWAGVTLVWGDPLTSLYTRYEQHELAERLTSIDGVWHTRGLAPTSSSDDRAPAAILLRRRAVAFEQTVVDGQPIGRIEIPRIGLSMVVVEGVSTSDLEKGPGDYGVASGRSTQLPGAGGVVAIAGHRTTFLHPFLRIDELRAGDRIALRMPYGTFRYTVYAHAVVASDDWSILRPARFEKLVLTACHPRFSATHRWVVFARLTASSPG